MKDAVREAQRQEVYELLKKEFLKTNQKPVTKMKKKDSKQAKPLPPWIIVSATDPKLKEEVEKHIAEKLSQLAQPADNEGMQSETEAREAI